jgi:hypothetical protein
VQVGSTLRVVRADDPNHAAAVAGDDDDAAAAKVEETPVSGADRARPGPAE